jgi:hypothetical protein
LRQAQDGKEKREEDSGKLSDGIHGALDARARLAVTEILTQSTGLPSFSFCSRLRRV